MIYRQAPIHRVSLPILVVAMIVTIGAVTVYAEQMARLTPELQIPIPEGWVLMADSTGLPAQLTYLHDSAEILIFQSRISGDDQIGNEIELKKSVDLVIDEVIHTLPDGQVMTSNGFYDEFRTGFTLEFLSTDSVSQVPMEHSLRGIIYRHPDDYQLLFTVWGKATVAVFPLVKEAIESVQSGLVYDGAQEDRVFVPPPTSYLPIILVVMAIVGLLLVRPPWKQRREKKLPPDITTAN